MKLSKSIAILLVCYFLISSFSFHVLAQQTSSKVPGTQGLQPMVIRADSLVVDDSNKMITFSGQVSAERQDFTIECDKMIIYYESSGSKSKSSEAPMGSKIKKIVAEGHVKIRRSEGGEALARHAEYYEGEDKVILTGQPMVKQGQNFVKGDRITIFLKENRSVVESSPQKKVKAVIYQKKESK